MSSYTIPNVIAQHPRGERIMDVFSHLLTERIVYLGTAIDPGVANTLIAQLLHLEAESTEQEINLYVNARAATCLPCCHLDTMQYIDAPVDHLRRAGHRLRRGAARGGTPGERALLPHARVVCTSPRPAGRARSRADHPGGRTGADARRHRDVPVAHTGPSTETLRRDTDRDRVLTAPAPARLRNRRPVLGSDDAFRPG